MIYRGHIENGRIVRDEDVHLADGTVVHVETVESPRNGDRPGQSLFETIKPLIGSLDLPEDFAAQHDHYVHGTSKK